MSDSVVIRSRYTRNEIISVMQEVATVMGSRKQKAHYVTGTSKVTLQTTFLEEKASAIRDRLKKLNGEIKQAEVTAKEPSETMLKLQSAKQTLTNEYNRFNEIVNLSRQRVKGKNKESIDVLFQEIDNFENQSIPRTNNLLSNAEQRNADIKEMKSTYFSAMAKQHTDFTAVLGFAASELELSSSELQGLTQEVQDIDKFTDTLVSQKLELSNQILALDSVIEEKQGDKKDLENTLSKLLSTKKRIDALDDPTTYINDLSVQLEENKLSLEAKQDVIGAVQNINNEVIEINVNLEEGINDYVTIIKEFEETLANI